MKEEIATKGNLPCGRCIGQDSCPMIRDVRKHLDGEKISTSDAAVKSAILKLKAEAKIQIGTELDIRVLCSHQHIRRRNRRM
ncbi:Chaperone protein DnaK [Frankliniella fusca]|uniref:Chaperone protein DnaK n=1 Tax=Frankliniella fusca TaxID=407009 RepID=A0AAE1LP59_9NEOP|nr:Chaperone protein DnaK [Frankliniella fusca]